MLLPGSHKGGASLQRGAVTGMLYWFQLKRTGDNDPQCGPGCPRIASDSIRSSGASQICGVNFAISTILDMSLKAVLTDSSQIKLFKNGLACLHKTGQGPPSSPLRIASNPAALISSSFRLAGAELTLEATPEKVGLTCPMRPISRPLVVLSRWQAGRHSAAAPS